MRILVADDQRRTRQSLKVPLSTSLPQTELWEAGTGEEARSAGADLFAGKGDPPECLLGAVSSLL